jgi:hypothetical protein
MQLTTKSVIFLASMIVFPSLSSADIKACQTKLPTDIPMVVIMQGSVECEAMTTQCFKGPMKKGDCHSCNGTGADGDGVCYRRSKDPSNPGAGLGPWTQCLTDNCEIN